MTRNKVDFVNRLDRFVDRSLNFCAKLYDYSDKIRRQKFWLRILAYLTIVPVINLLWIVATVTILFLYGVIAPLIDIVDWLRR